MSEAASKELQRAVDFANVNIQRVASLVSIYRLWKDGRGRRDVVATDLLRAAVVLLHATLESFLRDIAKHLLPTMSADIWMKTPLAGHEVSAAVWKGTFFTVWGPLPKLRFRHFEGRDSRISPPLVAVCLPPGRPRGRTGPRRQCTPAGVPMTTTAAGQIIRDDIEVLPVVRAHQLESVPPEQRWLVDTLWPAEGVGVIGAHPKLGKTWLGLELAVSIASGKPCLGRFEVKRRGRILHSTAGWHC
jgi:hypothetical protein